MTPLYNASNLLAGLHLKIEFYNPIRSMKYRAIPPFLIDLFNKGIIYEKSKLVVLTAGSAGIAVSWMAIQLKCKAIVIVPQNLPRNILNILEWLHAEIVFIPPSVSGRELLDQYSNLPDTYIFQQIKEYALIKYYHVVAEEIYHQISGISAVFVGIGTGASIMGIATKLKELDSSIKVFGVEPTEAAVASGGVWHPHNICGLAPPTSQPLLKKEWLHGIITIQSDDAWDQAKHFSSKTGILFGPSSGATICAAHQYKKENPSEKLISICHCGALEYF